MRVTMMLAAVAAATLLSGAAQAQTVPGQGQYQAALETMITSTAAGTCPEDVMAGELMAACIQQLPQMSQGLQSLGAIQSITFLRAEGEGAERTEFYSVTFAVGATLVWGIGHEVDGKFSQAFATQG
ncbi:hypothetical protein GVN24_33070 [Rhizobium sp. CRIBSB]|nr:hypothetical protein [Rhizobium sp. CRIBSB]